MAIERLPDQPTPLAPKGKGPTGPVKVTFMMQRHIYAEMVRIAEVKGIKKSWFLNWAALTEATLVDQIDQGKRVVVVEPNGRATAEFTLINYERAADSLPALPSNVIPFPIKSLENETKPIYPQSSVPAQETRGMRARFSRFLRNLGNKRSPEM